MNEVRLIDANALLDTTEHLAQVCFGQGQCYCERTKFQQLIKKQPTVDAVPVGFIEALHTYYVRRSKALQGRIGHMYTLYALALEKLVQSFNYVNAMDDEMKTERNCADGERRSE